MPARDMLTLLRWEADAQVINHFGEHVWLRPVLGDGKQAGITECCNVAEPCERHAALAKGGSDAR